MTHSVRNLGDHFSVGVWRVRNFRGSVNAQYQLEATWEEVARYDDFQKAANVCSFLNGGAPANIVTGEVSLHPGLIRA